MVIILVPTIGIIGCYFLFYLFYAGGTTVIDAYTYTQMTWHYPSEKDLMSIDYKAEAAEMASKFLVDIEKQRWEEKGLMFDPLLYDDVPKGMISAMIHATIHKKDKTPFYGNKVAHTTFQGRIFANENVSYQGDGIYRVRSLPETQFEAYGVEGNMNLEAYKIPKVTDIYVSTIQLTVEKGSFGRVKRTWKVLDQEFVKASMKENSIDHNISILYIPGTKAQEEQKRVQARIKKEPKI